MRRIGAAQFPQWKQRASFYHKMWQKGSKISQMIENA
jgi:hypothetical protein